MDAINNRPVSSHCDSATLLKRRGFYVNQYNVSSFWYLIIISFYPAAALRRISSLAGEGRGRDIKQTRPVRGEDGEDEDEAYGVEKLRNQLARPASFAEIAGEVHALSVHLPRTRINCANYAGDAILILRGIMRAARLCSRCEFRRFDVLSSQFATNRSACLS